VRQRCVFIGCGVTVGSRLGPVARVGDTSLEVERVGLEDGSKRVEVCVFSSVRFAVADAVGTVEGNAEVDVGIGLLG